MRDFHNDKLEQKIRSKRKRVVFSGAHIGQFVTILSVNKTRNFGMGRSMRPSCFVDAGASIFCLKEYLCTRRIRILPELR